LCRYGAASGVYHSRMRLKLLQAGEPVLRNVARPLTPKEIGNREIARLLEDMRETLRDAPGVGLAAPQVGVGIQLAIIEDRPEYTRDLAPEQLAERERSPVPFHVIINPVLKGIGKANVEFFEGCLSLNGFTAVVPRFREVRVQCLDQRGKRHEINARGWYARILQHEIDHLNGALYIDRMRSRTFSSLENFTRHWKPKSTREVIEAVK
jgi:peptide deformylase